MLVLAAPSGFAMAAAVGFSATGGGGGCRVGGVSAIAIGPGGGGSSMIGKTDAEGGPGVAGVVTCGGGAGVSSTVMDGDIAVGSGSGGDVSFGGGSKGLFTAGGTNEAGLAQESWFATRSRKRASLPSVRRGSVSSEIGSSHLSCQWRI